MCIEPRPWSAEKKNNLAGMASSPLLPLRRNCSLERHQRGTEAGHHGVPAGRRRRRHGIRWQTPWQLQGGKPRYNMHATGWRMHHLHRHSRRNIIQHRLTRLSTSACRLSHTDEASSADFLPPPTRLRFWVRAGADLEGVVGGQIRGSGRKYPSGGQGRSWRIF